MVVLIVVFMFIILCEERLFIIMIMFGCRFGISILCMNVWKIFVFVDVLIVELYSMLVIVIVVSMVSCF